MSDVRLLFWVKKCRVTREEWEAVKLAAAQLMRYRTWYLAREEQQGHGRAGNEWTEASADQVLLDRLPLAGGSIRESQLLQVTAELATRQGADFAVQHRYRQRRKPKKLGPPNKYGPEFRAQALDMIEAGMTQEHVADEMGCHVTTIGNWVRARRAA